MRANEAIRLIKAVGPEHAEKVAESMLTPGSGKTARVAAKMIRDAAKKVKAEAVQPTLPGIENITDGLTTAPIKRVAKRSKGNAEYSAVYANMSSQFLPLADSGYEQQRVFSQHRNGNHVIYKAMHMLNVLHRRGVTREEVLAVLQSAPKCGGWAHFLKPNSVAMYLSNNTYGLWRVVGKAPATGRQGGRPYLYVAAGMTVACGKRGRKS